MIACNRPRLTRQGVESWHAATPRDLADLTVVDDGSGAETSTMLEALRRKYGFTLIRNAASLGAGFVSNLAIWAAGALRSERGEFLYHSAADFYFRNGWLEGLIANWPLVERAGGALLAAYSHPYHLTTTKLEGTNGYDIHLKEAVAGGSWFMPWPIWKTFGPLNTDNRGLYVGSEDTEFNFRLRDAGLKVATLWPEMVVHTGRTNTEGKPTLGAELMPDVPGVLIE